MKTKAQLIEQNPFFGCSKLFILYQNKQKFSTSMLNEAYMEADTHEKKELFHSICFSAGDIVNRQHNIFGKKPIDKGGESFNESWITYLTWLLKVDETQFIKFLPLMVEYVGLRELLTLQVKTQRGKQSIIATWGLLDKLTTNPKVYKALVELIRSYVKGTNPFYKTQVCKFLNVPKFKRIRSGGKVGKMQEMTISKMKVYQHLLDSVSKECDWMVQTEPYKSYLGFKNFKKEYGQDFEYVLFSTQKILEFDQVAFQSWLNKLPAGGRYRVERKLFSKEGAVKHEKYTKLCAWWKDWEKAKEQAVKTVRTLEEKAKTAELSDVEKTKLKEAKKDAKVNTGAKSAFECAIDILEGKGSDTALFQALQKQDPLPNCGIVADKSGSMSRASIPIKFNDKYYQPHTVRDIILTLMLYKQNFDKTKNIVILFGSNAKIYDFGISQEVTVAQNRFMASKIEKVQLFNPLDTFITNFNRISGFIGTGDGSTNLDRVSDLLKSWANENAENLEQVQSVPMWIIISDNDLNNKSTVLGSFMQYQATLRSFGVDPVTVMFHCTGDTTNAYDNIPNVFSYTGLNASAIGTTLSKLTDLDVIDGFTPLKSLHESNRYELIRKSTL